MFCSYDGYVGPTIIGPIIWWKIILLIDNNSHSTTTLNYTKAVRVLLFNCSKQIIICINLSVVVMIMLLKEQPNRLNTSGIPSLHRLTVNASLQLKPFSTKVGFCLL